MEKKVKKKYEKKRKKVYNIKYFLFDERKVIVDTFGLTYFINN
jgi:hypothetical protein